MEVIQGERTVWRLPFEAIEPQRSPGSRHTKTPRDKRTGAYTATFAVTHPRWEPYAGKPHARLCAGGARRDTLIGGAALRGRSRRASVRGAYWGTRQALHETISQRSPRFSKTDDSNVGALMASPPALGFPDATAMPVAHAVSPLM